MEDLPPASPITWTAWTTVHCEKSPGLRVGAWRSGFARGRSAGMARSKTGLRGVGKPSGEVPTEPVGQFSLGEVDHPVIPPFRAAW